MDNASELEKLEELLRLDEQRVERLEHHLEEIKSAQTVIKDAIASLRSLGPDDGDMAYIIAPLEVVVSNDHEWINRGTTIDDWIAKVAKERDRLGKRIVETKQEIEQERAKQK